MAKAKIIQKRSQNSDQTRNNPFLVNMSYAFQHRENLYLTIDLLTDGDLRFHLVEMRRFSEAQTKFFEGYILSIQHICINIELFIETQNKRTSP